MTCSTCCTAASGVPSSEGTRIATWRWPQCHRSCAARGVPSSEGTRIATCSQRRRWVTPRKRWRPLFGGDEDRNQPMSGTVGGVVPGGVPSSEGTRIATRRELRGGWAGIGWRPLFGGDEDRNRGMYASGPASFQMWRPLFGGDEDRNLVEVTTDHTPDTWRPLFGGDEDRNSSGTVAPGGGMLRGVPSSEGTRIATTPPPWRALACTWRPLFGGDEDRNLARISKLPKTAQVASPLRRGRGSQHCNGNALRPSIVTWRPLFGGDEDRNSPVRSMSWTR